MTKEQEKIIEQVEEFNTSFDCGKYRKSIKEVLNMLKETSAESAEKDKIIAEKSAEIEKYKKESKQYFETTTRQAKQFDAEIEKKNKEIEKLTIKNKDLLRKLRNRVRDVKKLQKYSLYKKEFSTLNKQIKEKDAEIEKLKTDFKIVDQECSRLERKEAKQDKMIDLIINTVYKRFKAELVLEYGFENEEQFKQCFERRVEDETI